MHTHIYMYTVHLIMSPQFDIFDDNVKVRDHVAVEHLAPGQMWTKTSRRFLNDTRRVVLGSLEILNGAGWCVVQHRVALVDSPENQPSCVRLC